MGRKAWWVTVHGVLRNLRATSRHLKKTLSWPCYAHHTGGEASRQMKPWAQLTWQTGSSCTSRPQGCGGGDSRWPEPPPARSLSLLLPKAHFPSADTVCLNPLKVTERVLSKPLRIRSSFFLSSSPAFPKHQWEKEISVRIGNRKELWSPGLGEGKIWGFSQIIWNNKRMGFRELCFLFVPKRLLTVEVLRFGPKEKWSYKM